MANLTLLAMQAAEAAKAAEATPKTGPIPQWLLVALYILGAIAVVVVPMVLAWLIATSLRVKDLQRRLAVVLFTATVGIVVIALRLHPTLGVDLSGGVILVYGVDLESSALGAADELAADKTQATDRTARVAKRNIGTKKGADATNPSEHVDMDALVQAVSRRINPDGLKEISVRAFGVNQIEVVIPKAEGAEIDEIKRRIATAGVLLFRIVANNKDHKAIITRAREQLEDPLLKLSRDVRDSKGTLIARWTPVAREKEARKAVKPLKVNVTNDIIRDARTGELLTNIPREAMNSDSHPTAFEEWLAKKGIESVEVLMVEPEELVYDMRGDFLGMVKQDFDPRTNHPCVSFSTKGKGVRRMAALTTLNKPDTAPPFFRRLGIVLDNELLSAPQIQSTISDHGQITGQFTMDEVRVLVGVLNAGKLPAVLYKEPISQNQIGPLLGLQTIRLGALSTIITLVVVFVFVWFYYRWSGMVACMALLLNLVLTYALMILLGASLTLPGLAGLVLTVGMSVDANVLIYERLREEMARGATLRMAIRNAFSRATTTIVDSNLTTLITGVVLYAIGTDQVRGFAVTLILGILMCMYTAIYFSRLIFDLAERRKWITKLVMVQWVPETHIDFLRLKWPTIIGSSVIIIAGLIATFERGNRLLDIDFSGGTSVVMELLKPTTDEKARNKLKESFQNMEVNGVSVEYTLTEVRVEKKREGTIWRVDSSLQNVKQLQQVLQKSFDLVTYKMTFTPPKEITLRTDTGEVPASGNSTSAPESTKTKSSESTNSTKTGSSTPIKTESESQPTGEAPESESKNPPGCQETQGAAEPPPTTTPEITQPTNSQPTNDAPPPPVENPPVENPPVENAPTPGTANTRVGTETTITLTSPLSKEALGQLIQDAADQLKKGYVSVNAVTTKLDVSGSDASKEWDLKMGIDPTSANEMLLQVQKKINGTPAWVQASVIGSQVAGDTRGKAIAAMLASFLGTIAYLWFRFHRIEFGLAAVIAVFHDVLVALAFIAFSHYFVGAFGHVPGLGIDEFKISLPVIAAFLTLIGYSLNDTIVIFDRLREIRGKSHELTPKMINDSVNQTLSRTLLTGGLTFSSVVILYFVGGEGIHGFAYTLFIGMIAGTYSTVFIASPCLLWMLERDKRHAKASGKA